MDNNYDFARHATAAFVLWTLETEIGYACVRVCMQQRRQIGRMNVLQK